MKYLHTMVRVSNIEESLNFWCNKLGLIETRRIDLVASDDQESSNETKSPELELTYNWDGDETLETGRSWGHLAYKVENIYETCQNLMDKGVIINRPPHDGHMAFIKSPDNVSIELIQKNGSLPPQEPWVSMKNTGSW